MSDLQGVIFDLDGVLVRTDEFHYRAWKDLADELGIPFDREVNEQLRGVSRAQSLKLIYANADEPLPPDDEFQAQMSRKNDRYRQLISEMTPEDVLAGSVDLLEGLRDEGVAVAVASASRNCKLVLDRTDLAGHCDAVVDGHDVSASKPDPQGFLIAAKRLEAHPENCIGVEDAASGIEAIRRARMVAVGIGEAGSEGDLVVDDVDELSVDLLRETFQKFKVS